MKRIAIAVSLAASLALAPWAHAGPAVAVMTDPAGDAGLNGEALPGAAQAGMDIVKGTIQRTGADLVFTVTMASMPSQGSMPEAARLLYHFDVEKEPWRITAKSVDVGKPDLVARTGTERLGKIESAGHFRLEQCASDTTLPITLSQCNPVAYLKGKVDVAAKSLSWTVPLATLKAKPGMKVKPGTSGASSTSCEICWVLHKAERSLTPITVVDGAAASAYTIPKS